jgi:hypothetical protein
MAGGWTKWVRARRHRREQVAGAPFQQSVEYRDDPRSSFYGVYVFADYQKRHVFGLIQKGRRLEKVRLLTTAPQQVVSIGEDASGELYLVGYEGDLYKLDLASSRWE